MIVALWAAFGSHAQAFVCVDPGKLQNRTKWRGYFMKRTGFVALLGIMILALAVSPVLAQCGPWGPHPPAPGPGTAYGWGCYPGSYAQGCRSGPTVGGWCGFYNDWNSGGFGMVSTQAVVMHVLFPALAPNCPISQLADWTAKPERVDHFDISGQIDYYFVMAYDASGTLTKVELFDAANALVAYTDCVYNSGGQIVKTLNYDSTGTELSYSDFVYNTAGQLANVNTYVNGISAYTLRCIYNSSGRITRVSQFNPGGVLRMYTRCLYNVSGQLRKTVSCSAGGAVLEARTYVYNAAGKIRRVSDFNNAGALNGYGRYMRNAVGQATGTSFYNASNIQTGRSSCYFNLP